MKARTERILEQALSLGETARARLAGALLDSLEDDEPEPGVEEAWAREVKRRLDEIDSGRAKLVPWSQVRKDLLKIRRAKKRRSPSR